MSRKTRWTIVALILLVAGIAAWRTLAPANRYTGMGEYVEPDEDTYTGTVIAAAIEIINQNREKWAADNPGQTPLPYGRDVHTKSLGCLEASFTLNENIDPALRIGLFGREKKQYESWIRFSSGNSEPQSDLIKDARGMAIKIMGVEGTKLLPDEEDAPTQDFVLMNNPVYFVRELKDYIELTEHLARGDDFGYFIGFRNPATWRLREMWLALGTLKAPPDSLFSTRFWSASAYRLGPAQYVKYSATPVSCTPDGPEPAPAPGVDRENDPDFLTTDMAALNEQGPACYDFAIQRQVVGKNMPVEDTTVEWSEADSPFIRVARIEVLSGQDFTSEAAMGVCENLSFNPWHALPDHEPVGQMNRVRKRLYQEVARYRRGENDEICQEPTSWAETPGSCMVADAP